jgi:hypothetical protein
LSTTLRSASAQAINATIVFWIIGACYRTFRAKTWETLALLLVGFSNIIWNAPLGGLIAPWNDYLQDWLMMIPSAGAGTGIIIGTACGAAVMAIRIISGMERGYLGVVTED